MEGGDLLLDGCPYAGDLPQLSPPDHLTQRLGECAKALSSAEVSLGLERAVTTQLDPLTELAERSRHGSCIEVVRFGQHGSENDADRRRLRSAEQSTLYRGLAVCILSRPLAHASIGEDANSKGALVVGWVDGRGRGGRRRSVPDRRAMVSVGPDAKPGRPTWMSEDTLQFANAAVGCYRVQASRRGEQSCEPAEVVLDAVWASCWPEEKALFSSALADTDDDMAAMALLDEIETENRAEITRVIRFAQAASGRCRLTEH